eukprot:CAMPEP_0198598848 /NCGR_PEP_ID=MMETSP1462-20131121/146214_1 /TAXON_ID=1333877 /ORGANISM="Brandtodinium nutriculum, Strain RCC3387" /LENGTH=72 /DNA_ID=CAMNT_0044330523 /DNA_START=27 /DNA_END=241 /DNA_ORIENTATION=+
MVLLSLAARTCMSTGSSGTRTVPDSSGSHDRIDRQYKYHSQSPCARFGSGPPKHAQKLPWLVFAASTDWTRG